MVECLRVGACLPPATVTSIGGQLEQGGQRLNSSLLVHGHHLRVHFQRINGRRNIPVMNTNRAGYPPPGVKAPTQPILPPTSHTLRPHHLQIVKLLLLVFHKYGDERLPPPFVLHMYRVLLAEISEVLGSVNNTCQIIEVI